MLYIYITYYFTNLEIMLLWIWSDACSLNSWSITYPQPCWAFFVILDANLSSVYLPNYYDIYCIHISKKIFKMLMKKLDTFKI